MNQEIQDGLRPMFERARQQGLWFYSPYQQLWFSPDALEREQHKGRFVWGSVNWQLRDPMERVTRMREEAKAMSDRADELEREITQPTS